MRTWPINRLWLMPAAGLLICLLLLVRTRPGITQSALDSAAIDRFLIEQMAAQRIPGLALTIIQGDQVRYSQGYGIANAQQPVTPHTQFYLASLSKSFTAVAVMQLVEAGQIDLDQPVQRYLPELSLADASLTAQITVRHLLNQTSGLADAGFPEMRLPQPATTSARITTLRTARLVEPPGREFHYTNLNYQILARLVEVVSGEPFSSYLQHHIFAPLQMTQTVNVLTSAETAQKATKLAQGHLVAYGIPFPAAEEQGYLGGSGGVISTAADLANYLILHTTEGHFQGTQLLTPASMAVLHTPPTTPTSDYAMGWLATTVNGQQRLEHNGILSTFYTEMVLLPEQEVAFVLLYNVHSLEQDLLGFPTIKQGLIDRLTGTAPTNGVLNVGLFGALIGLLTLLSLALGMRGLWRLPVWQQWAVTHARWHVLPGVIWSLLPAVLVLGMPALVLSTAGRAFSYLTIYRSMIGVMSWFTICAVFGVLNGGIRLLWLVRHARS